MEASNGAIANKRLLYGVETATWTKPTNEQPAEGIYVFGGYTLAPIAIIETDSVRRFDFPNDAGAGLHVRRAVAEFIENPEAYPGDARRRYGKSFGPETGRQRAARVNRSRGAVS